MNPSKLICSPDSGNTYYFRSYIPTDLIKHFDGVRQFRVSLKCAIKSRSFRITKILDVKVSSLFEEIRIGMKSLDIEQIKEILRIEIRKQILLKTLDDELSQYFDVSPLTNVSSGKKNR
jgi:hypothetical protein